MIAVIYRFCLVKKPMYAGLSLPMRVETTKKVAFRGPQCFEPPMARRPPVVNLVMLVKFISHKSSHPPSKFLPNHREITGLLEVVKESR